MTMPDTHNQFFQQINDAGYNTLTHSSSRNVPSFGSTSNALFPERFSEEFGQDAGTSSSGIGVSQGFRDWLAEHGTTLPQEVFTTIQNKVHALSARQRSGVTVFEHVLHKTTNWGHIPAGPIAYDHRLVGASAPAGKYIGSLQSGTASDAPLTSGPCGELGADYNLHCETESCYSAASAASTINIETSCASYANLIVLAHCMVVENLDIAYDAYMHYGYGTANFKDFLYRAVGYTIVFGAAIPWRYDISCEWNGCNDNPAATDNPHLQRKIILNADFVKTLYINYRLLSSSDVKARHCLLSAYAVVLFHEISHGAINIRGYDNEEPALNELQNYFQYYLLKRYCILGFSTSSPTPIDCNWVDNWNEMVCDPALRMEKHGILPCVS